MLAFVYTLLQSHRVLNSHWTRKKLTTDSGVDKQIFFLFAVKSFLKSGSVQALWRQTSSLSWTAFGSKLTILNWYTDKFSTFSGGFRIYFFRSSSTAKFKRKAYFTKGVQFLKQTYPKQMEKNKRKLRESSNLRVSENSSGLCRLTRGRTFSFLLATRWLRGLAGDRKFSFSPYFRIHDTLELNFFRIKSLNAFTSPQRL